MIMLEDKKPKIVKQKNSKNSKNIHCKNCINDYDDPQMCIFCVNGSHQTLGQ